MQPGLQLALLLAILLPATKIAGSLCSRFSIPAILGELLVGVVLGPGAVNLLHLHIFAGGEATSALMLMAQVGGFVLMFIAGLETDVDRMREASGTAFLVALFGVIWPFVLGAGVGHLFGLSWKTACFLGGALTATSVSISARTLMDAGQMSSPEATIILGAAVIDDVMGLFVLAFLAASGAASHGGFGLAPMASDWLQEKLPFAGVHPLIVQMVAISVAVTVFFVAGYCLANRFLDPLIRQFRKLSANEAVPSCVLGLLLVYAISAEWLGSVAGITGAYLLGYVFASSEYKADVERSFAAVGHGLLIPLFFVSIGLSSDYRALSGHWALLGAVFVVAIVGKLVGCGSAALATGMNWVASFRIGCGMISRGEVGLIVTAMGATTGIFKKPEVAVMVAIVLLTTLITPLALRGAFQLKSDDDPQSLTDEVEAFTMSSPPEISAPAPTQADDGITEELNQPDRQIITARSPLLTSLAPDQETLG